jgi:hypothetical protein
MTTFPRTLPDAEYSIDMTSIIVLDLNQRVSPKL